MFTDKPHVKSGSGSGIGVRNDNERIRLYFGQEYGLSIEIRSSRDGIVRDDHMQAGAPLRRQRGKRSMSNREKISWCAGVLLLVMLYLLSSTDLIIKEKKREICRISVIIDNVNDNYYESFPAGMDMAEKKYQADVNFITLYAENDEEQQEELIVREQSEVERMRLSASRSGEDPRSRSFPIS